MNDSSAVFTGTFTQSGNVISENSSAIIHAAKAGAELAQLVRWMTLNQEVPGSNLDMAI